MADWIPDSNGVNRILYSGNLALGLEKVELGSPTGKLGVGLSRDQADCKERTGSPCPSAPHFLSSPRKFPASLYFIYFFHLNFRSQTGQCWFQCIPGIKASPNPAGLRGFLLLVSQESKQGCTAKSCECFGFLDQRSTQASSHKALLAS